MKLADKVYLDYVETSDMFMKAGCNPPLPTLPPAEIENMEYREDFGFNYDLYLEELNKSKKD